MKNRPHGSHSEDCDFELGIKLPVPVNCASKMITNLTDACISHDPSIATECPSGSKLGCATSDCSWMASGQPQQGTARHYDVSKSTLWERLNGAKSHEREMNSRQRLSLAKTRALAEHAQRMQDLHFPLTPADIRLEAQWIWQKRNGPGDANDADQVIGVNWYQEVFLKDMVNKLGKGLERNRATCASHAQLESGTWM